MSEHRRNLTDLQSQQLYIKDNCERVGRKIRGSHEFKLLEQIFYFNLFDFINNY